MVGQERRQLRLLEGGGEEMLGCKAPKRLDGHLLPLEEECELSGDLGGSHRLLLAKRLAHILDACVHSVGLQRLITIGRAPHTLEVQVEVFDGGRPHMLAHKRVEESVRALVEDCPRHAGRRRRCAECCG